CISSRSTADIAVLVLSSFPTRRSSDLRGQVMGNISIVISVAPALGPTISGLILSFAPWRALFVLVLPIAAAALLFGLSRIENVKDGKSTRLNSSHVSISYAVLCLKK